MRRASGVQDVPDHLGSGEFSQDTAANPALCTEDGEQHVFGSDALTTQALGLESGNLHDLSYRRGDLYRSVSLSCVRFGQLSGEAARLV